MLLFFCFKSKIATIIVKYKMSISRNKGCNFGPINFCLTFFWPINLLKYKWTDHDVLDKNVGWSIVSRPWGFGKGLVSLVWFFFFFLVVTDCSHTEFFFFLRLASCGNRNVHLSSKPTDAKGYFNWSIASPLVLAKIPIGLLITVLFLKTLLLSLELSLKLKLLWFEEKETFFETEM